MKIKYLFSDMDGTLINASNKVSKKNAAVIQDFMAKGGHFGIATGRPEVSIHHFFEDVEPNYYCILYNGAVIYDFHKRKFLYKTILTYPIIEAIYNLTVSYGDSLMLEAFTEGAAQIIKQAVYQDPILKDEPDLFVESDLEACRDGVIKLIICGETEDLKQIEQQLLNDPMIREHTDLVYSCDFYLEVMPKGISKGKALEKLCELENIDIKTCAAIGDYYNDIELLQVVGYSGTTSLAPDEVKKHAAYIAKSHDEDAVAEFITHINTLT